jgi:DNA-binding protein HU-beta
MNQAEVIQSVRSQLDHLTKADVTAVLATFAEIVKGELASGNEVALIGLGKLSIKERAARQGRNPATGETIEIAAKRVPQFSASKALKDAVA